MRKRLRILIILTLFAIMYLLAAHTLIAEEASVEAQPEADYIIVLGARLYGEEPSPSLLLRLEAATDYLNENPSTTAVLSGGQGENETIPEAEAMRRFLMDKGIPSERLIIESISSNTLENLKYSFSIIDELDSSEDKIVVIISSEYHIFRAKMLAKRLGYDTQGLPAEVPESVVVISWLREYLALGKSLIFDW